MELSLSSGVRELPGIGEARAKSLDRLHLGTVEDLIRYLPRSYEDRRAVRTIRDAGNEGEVCVAGMVAETPRLSRVSKGLELTKAKIVDDTGSMVVTFFNQGYVRDALRPGETYIFYGKVERIGNRAQMTNPAFEREDRARFTGRIMPIYPLTAGITNNLLAGLTLRCVESCADQIPECLPGWVREDYGLAQCEFSYRNIHFPTDEAALELARRRLIFEELFYLSCGLSFLRRRRVDQAGPAFLPRPLETFCTLLPFQLTDAQRRAMEEAAADLTDPRPMNRLVQGDVGSGKTVVAAACAWLAFCSGWQTALMAPTEILAEQHYRTLTALLAPAGLTVGLLTGSMSASEKKNIKKMLGEGSLHLLVGTHALLSQGVEFARLGLVITDEQHRFGVGQRSALSAKGGAVTPNVLVMSATPIPRTLALIIYGDLEVSVIDELPPGRTPVQTFLVREDKRQRMYGFVRKLVREGRQAYIVCPAVEERREPEDGGLWGSVAQGGTPQLKAAATYAEELEKLVFPDLRVGLVHGKLKPREKDKVMARFAAGDLDILVSTTVIEVGVDVPNAALMIVENAERFGLSQLHQLRGRVGRGEFQSYCVLMTSTRNLDSLARLRVLKGTTDGFRIAEEDLKLRGPGDFFGSRQHGLPALRVADLAGDMRVLKEAQAAAAALLGRDPELDVPEHQLLLERVRKLFSEDPDIFN